MSSTAAQTPDPIIVPGPGRAPRRPGGPAAPDRERLRVVGPRRSEAGRFPFVVLVTALLVGGVVGLLLFNTSMQQAAFTESKLQDQATNLAAREQTMQMQVERMQDPQRVARKARQLGLVIPANPTVLHVPSGKVEGAATPAGRGATPPLFPRKPAPSASTAEPGSGNPAARQGGAGR